MHEQQSTLFKDWQAVAESVAQLKQSTSPFSAVLFQKLENLLQLIYQSLCYQTTSISIPDTSFQDIQTTILFLQHNIPLYYQGKQVVPLQTALERLRQDLERFLVHRKKIVIFYTSNGNGHEVAAQAVFQGLHYCFGQDYDVEAIDVLAETSKILNTAVGAAYDVSIKFKPEVFGWLFEQTNSRKQVKFFNYISYPTWSRKVEDIFQEKQPDIVISTYPAWDYAVNRARKKYSKPLPYVSIITDSIAIHKAWLAEQVDHYIVANEDTAHILRRNSIPSEKIKVLGFPLRLPFYEPVHVTKVRKEFGLDPRKKTILYSVGTGASPKDLEPLLYLDKKLDPNKFQMLLIFGKKTDLQEKFNKLPKKKLNYSVIGWTNRMPELMEVADVLVTKAGGAIVMEAIQKELPLIISKLLPGQEEGNITLLKRYGLGVLALNNQSLHKAILKQVGLKGSPKTKANFQKVKNPRATMMIAEFIKSLIEKKNEK